MRLKRSFQLEILIVLLALTARLIPGPRTIDDAYITFRYAQNLLSGHGFVYNPGEAVLGTTTPLYALVLATLGLFFGGGQAPFPTIALLLNALADGMTCWLLIRLADALGYRRAGLAAAAVWAIAPWSVTFSIGGMETSLLILFGMATFYFYSIDKPVLSALCGSLSLLTRPDALLLLIPLMIERIRRSIRSNQTDSITILEICVFVIPLLTWGAFATAFFGNPIPLSVSAKTAAYHLATEAGFVRMLQHYATPFIGSETFGTWWIAVGLVLYPVLFGLGAIKILREKPNAWPILVYPWLYMLTFSVANPLIFRWYLTPPLIIYFFGIFLGSERLAFDMKSKLPPIILVAVAFTLTLLGWVLQPDHGPKRPAPEMAYIQLELHYQEAANILQDHIQSDEMLAAGDIGVLGYYTQAYILDTLGLITPRATEYYPLPEGSYVGNYAISADLITDYQPDYLVFPEVYGRRTLLEDPEFIESYDLLETIPSDIYDSKGIYIFVRQK